MKVKDIKKQGIYYNVSDVARILNFSKSTAYKIIRQLNKELGDKGYYIRQGMVPIAYFNQRYGIGTI